VHKKPNPYIDTRRNNSLDNGPRRIKNNITIDIDPVAHPKGTDRYNREGRKRNDKPMKVLNQML
jgi:hypothetical protein